MYSFNTVNGKYCCNVAIPTNKMERKMRFNTVNGKYCCNVKFDKLSIEEYLFQYRKR